MSNTSSRFTDFNVRAILICLAISTGLWLLTKLSEQYNTQFSMDIKLVEAPANQLVTGNEQQTVKFSMQAKGYKTFRLMFLADSKRVVPISLSSVPYRLEGGYTYSFSSQYLAETIAKILNINPSDITMNDDKVYFEMETLKSKVVPVMLRSDISTQQRYEVYGLPIIDPATVTVFGPKNVLDTLCAVHTKLLSKLAVNQSVEEMVPLDLVDEKLRCESTEVKVSIEVLQFTEQELVVPISVPDTLKMRLFPETVKIKYIVAMKDYPSMKPEMFRAEIDPSQIDSYNTLLGVRITNRPDNIELISVDPQGVEFLIIE